VAGNKKIVHTLQDSQRPPEVLTRPRQPRGWLMQEYIFESVVGLKIFVGSCAFVAQRGLFPVKLF
jgi:hypothetical protein